MPDLVLLKFLCVKCREFFTGIDVGSLFKRGGKNEHISCSDFNE